MNKSFSIQLIDVEKIRPTEEHDSSHMSDLLTEIEISATWTHPLLVDIRHYALMDGHHRYQAAKRLGLKKVPVICLDYDDPIVKLESWRPDLVFKPEDVWNAALTGNLLGIKSTRHVISALLPFCRVPLEQLINSIETCQPIIPAAAYPSKVQSLANCYHKLGLSIGISTVSAGALAVESAETIAPHQHLRLMLQADPAMSALLDASPCRIALGRNTDFPFSFLSDDLLVLPPSLLNEPTVLSIAARWGIEAATALLARETNTRRIAGLLRYGAELLRSAPSVARSVFLEELPSEVAAELWGNRAQNPSKQLLSWMTHRLGKDNSNEFELVNNSVLPLELPTEELLLSNGDTRLTVDRKTMKNKYGTTPRPRPEAVHFSSSTASSISAYGFLYCDLLRRDLLHASLRENQSQSQLRSKLTESIVTMILDMLNIEDDSCDGILAASGTDTELLAVLIARADAGESEVTNILISPGETGRGVKLAGAGQHFDVLTSTGKEVVSGQRLWPEFEANVEEINIRTSTGFPRDLSELDDEFLAKGIAALNTGHHVLAHVLLGSKTGLEGPSEKAVNDLIAYNPDKVDVVVDCCQMRSDNALLKRCIDKGWMVQVSGSKFLTGPPFSGALLLPHKFRTRVDRIAELFIEAEGSIGFQEDWSRWWVNKIPPQTQVPNFGVPFRWLPALMEAKLFAKVPEAMKDYVFKKFFDSAVARLNQSTLLKLVNIESTTTDKQRNYNFQKDSIISFEVYAKTWDGQVKVLEEVACRNIFEMLNADVSRVFPDQSHAKRMVLSQQFHIGQPVVIGEKSHKRTVLRLVIGARFFNIIGHAGPGGIKAALESEISDLLRAIDKLEILAENWWKTLEAN